MTRCDDCGGEGCIGAHGVFEGELKSVYLCRECYFTHFGVKASAERSHDDQENKSTEDFD